jgi:chloramphenicol-sensitive protein RarD
MRVGILYASTAYLIWGLLPLYLRALQSVPAHEILLHRVVWSWVFLVGLLACKRHWRWLAGAVRQPRVLLGFTASALLLSVNWFIYIWAVNAGRVVDASLGYFINPLFSVMLGYLVLKERLRTGQWLAVGLAALGVVWLTVQAGAPPWIGLSLAATFGAYGLLRKTAALDALEGLALETALLGPFAAVALVWLAQHGEAAFVHADTHQWLLLLAAGPVTAIPLLCFAAGARRIPLSLLGLLQYIGPSLQLALGVLLWHEPFRPAKFAGYALIWSALALYTLEGVWTRRRPAAVSA